MTLARGDRLFFCAILQDVPFQFTPLREGRLAASRCQSLHDDFNSRPSARGDKKTCGKPQKGIISIHAPPRGATSHPHVVEQIEIYFNSRPSARGDKVGTDYLAEKRLFQFTPLREGRRILKPRLKKAYSYFNSRPSARGDIAFLLSSRNARISIHAPPRGATRLIAL